MRYDYPQDWSDYVESCDDIEEPEVGVCTFREQTLDDIVEGDLGVVCEVAPCEVNNGPEGEGVADAAEAFFEEDTYGFIGFGWLKQQRAA